MRVRDSIVPDKKRVLPLIFELGKYECTELRKFLSGYAWQNCGFDLSKTGTGERHSLFRAAEIIVQQGGGLERVKPMIMEFCKAHAV